MQVTTGSVDSLWCTSSLHTHLSGFAGFLGALLFTTAVVDIFVAPLRNGPPVTNPVAAFVRLQEDQTAAELALSRAQLFPLKKENARLLRDNNLLHLKVSCTTLSTAAG